MQCLTDGQQLISVFVPQGLTCYSSGCFSCVAESKHWENILIATGRIAFPGMEASRLLFFPVHSSFEEQSKQLDTRQRHFIMVDSAQIDDAHKCIVVVVFSPAYQRVAASFWPAAFSIWLVDGKQWQAYQNCQCLTKQKHRSTMEI